MALGSVARLNIVVDSSQLRALEQRLAAVERASQRTEAQAVRTSRAIGGLTGAVLALASALAVRQIVDYADAWARIQGRLGLVTSAHEEMIAVQERLFAVAQRSRAAYEGIAQLYVRLAQNTKELALTQGQMVRITETVSKAMLIGGAAASEVRGGVLQLSQALASGQLRGDEFRSVLENMPRVVIALTDKLGITRDELYKMAEQGKITSRILAQSLLEASRQIDEEFRKLPVTVDQAIVVASNAMERYIGRVNEASGATRTLSNILVTLSDRLDSPEAVQAGVAFAEGLAEGLRIAGEAAILLGNNLDLVVGVIKIMLALRVVAFFRDLTLAIRLMTAAMAANPFFSFLSIAAAVATVIFELSDGFENLAAVGPRIETAVGGAVDRIQAKLNEVFGTDSILGSTNLNRMADDLKSFLDRVAGVGPVDPTEIATRQMRILQAELDKALTEASQKLNEFNLTATTLMALPGAAGMQGQDVKDFLTKMDELRTQMQEGDPTAWIAMNDQILKMSKGFGDSADEAYKLLKQLSDLDGQLTALNDRQVKIRFTIDDRDLVTKTLNEVPVQPYGPVPDVTTGEIAWGSANFPIPPTTIDTLIRGKGVTPEDKAKRDPFKEAARNINDQILAEQRLTVAYQQGAGAVAMAERATERYNAISDLQSKKLKPAQIAQLTAEINKLHDLKDANVAAAQAMEIRQGLQRDTERAQLEVSLLGSSDEKINVEIRLLEIRNQLQDQGISNYKEMAESFRPQVEAAERANAMLERQKAAAEAIAGVFEQAFDRVGSAITEAFTKGEAAAIDFQSITEGVLSEILQAIIKFTILNPLKNALFGGNEPTTSDIGGILGDILGNKPKTDETKPANDNVKTEMDKLLSGGLNATVGSATLSIGSATVSMGTTPGSLIPDRPDVTISGADGVNRMAGGAGEDTIATAGAKIAANANTFGDTFGGVLGRLANSMAGSSNIFVQGFGSILSALLQGKIRRASCRERVL